MSTKTLLNDEGNTPSNEPNNEPSNEPQNTPEMAEWLSGIEGIGDVPDEILSDPSLKAITNVPGLLKSYVNAQKMVGADKLIIPKKDAPEEDWRSVFNKLGAPETVEDYGMEPEEGVDEGYFKAYLEEAHKAGLLPGQAKRLSDFHINFTRDYEKELQTRAERELEEQVENFKAEEGEKFNETVFNAQAAIKQFDDQDGNFAKLVEENPYIGNNPELIRYLARVASHLTEDTFRESSTSNIGVSLQEAQEKLNTIQGDYDGPYYNAAHPDHKRIVQEVGRLTQRLMQG